MIGREIGFVWQVVRTTERTLSLSRLGARRKSDDKERRDASDVFDDCQRGRRERHLNKCDGQDGSTRNLAELRRMVITLYAIVHPFEYDGLVPNPQPAFIRRIKFNFCYHS